MFWFPSHWLGGRGQGTNGHKIVLSNQSPDELQMLAASPPLKGHIMAMEPPKEVVNGRLRAFKVFDYCFDAITSANGLQLAKMGVWIVVLYLFYSIVGEMQAESRRDREFYRREAERAHGLAAQRAEQEKELTAAVRESMEMARKEILERHRKELKEQP